MSSRTRPVSPASTAVRPRLRSNFVTWTERRLAQAGTAAGRQTPFPPVAALVPQIAALVRFPAPKVENETTDLLSERTLRQPWPGVTGRDWKTALREAKPLSATARRELLTLLADHPDERITTHILAALTTLLTARVRWWSTTAPVPHPLRWWMAEQGACPTPSESPTSLGPILATRVTELVEAQLAAGETFTPLQRQVMRSWQVVLEHTSREIVGDKDRLATVRACYGGVPTPHTPPPVVQRIRAALTQLTQELTTPKEVETWCTNLAKEDVGVPGILADLLHEMPVYQTAEGLQTLLQLQSLGESTDIERLAEAYITHPLMRTPNARIQSGLQILTSLMLGGLERHRGIHANYHGWVDGLLPAILQRLDQMPAVRPRLEARVRELWDRLREVHAFMPGARDGIRDEMQARDLLRWPVVWRVLPSLVTPDEPLAPRPLEERDFAWLRWADGPHLLRALTQVLQELGELEPDDDHLLQDVQPLLETVAPEVWRALPPKIWKGPLSSRSKDVRLWAIQLLGQTPATEGSPRRTR